MTADALSVSLRRASGLFRQLVWSLGSERVRRDGPRVLAGVCLVGVDVVAETRCWSSRSSVWVKFRVRVPVMALTVAGWDRA